MKKLLTNLKKNFEELQNGGTATSNLTSLEKLRLLKRVREKLATGDKHYICTAILDEYRLAFRKHFYNTNYAISVNTLLESDLNSDFLIELTVPELLNFKPNPIVGPTIWFYAEDLESRLAVIDKTIRFIEDELGYLQDEQS